VGGRLEVAEEDKLTKFRRIRFSWNVAVFYETLGQLLLSENFCTTLSTIDNLVKTEINLSSNAYHSPNKCDNFSRDDI
jgi:hypothetical protein